MNGLSVGSNRDFRLMMMSAAVFAMTDGLTYTILQLYLKSVGFTGTNVGRFVLVQGITAAALLLPLGIVSDRVDRRKLVALGAASSSTAVLIVVAAREEPLIMIAASLFGLGSAMYSPSLSALISEKVGDGDLEAAYTSQSVLVQAVYGISAMIGWIPELLAGSGYALPDAYRISIIWLVPLGFAAALPVLRVRKPDGRPRKGFRMIRNPVIVKVTFTQVLIGFGAGLSIPMLSYYLSAKFGVESGPIGTVNSVVSFISIPFFFLAPTIAHRFGSLKAIVVPQVLSIPLMALLPLSPSFSVAAVLFISRQILMNMSSPLLTAFIMRHASPSERATTSAMTAIAWRVPNSIAAQIGGSIFDFSLDLPLYATAAIYAVYITVFFLLFRDMEKEQR
ncbi:MAG: MFS transporter [Candidatus Methanosuratincola sp.]|jgi:MFS family permease|nr:MFS transporter [Candidatus Methanosuratincola sp.]